jgi:hypothetical protein
VAYPFNDSDFIISESLLALYLDEYDSTPWDAMKYLISGVMYGGHVTDDWDRRLMNGYIADLFCEDALKDGYRLSNSVHYTTQPHGDKQSYHDYLTALPAIDPPASDVCCAPSVQPGFSFCCCVHGLLARPKADHPPPATLRTLCTSTHMQEEGESRLRRGWK